MCVERLFSCMLMYWVFTCPFCFAVRYCNTALAFMSSFQLVNSHQTQSALQQEQECWHGGAICCASHDTCDACVEARSLAGVDFMVLSPPVLAALRSTPTLQVP